MLCNYIDLAGRHMTMKEKVERIKTKRDEFVTNDPLKEGKVPFAVKWKRYKRFFCTSKTPPSSLSKLKK
jgi:hypothetical protein